MVINKTYDCLIIGAGPTGLGAANRLKELGVTNFLIIEKNDKPGGLSRSFLDEKGFTWDIGGHVLFSHYKYFDKSIANLLGKDGWLSHERESWIWITNTFVPYPFQNNFRYLSKELSWKCINGLLDVWRDVNSVGSGRIRHFEEWIEKTFGQGIAELFMKPYNTKVWAYSLNKMSFSWIAERVAVPDIKRALKNVLFRKDDLSWGPNHLFKFPRKGGTGAIWLALASVIGQQHIKYGEEVESIDPSLKYVVTKSGNIYRYKHLLSTMPLDLLCKSLTPRSKYSYIAKKASGLKHSSSNIVGIGLRGTPPRELKTKGWIYFPEQEYCFYRATIFSNYSPQNVPTTDHYWSVMTETSESKFKKVNHRLLAKQTIEGLRKAGIIRDKKEVVSVFQYRVEYGYPIPSIKRDSILGEIISKLDKLGVYSRGRFGLWKYEVSNQDHSFMQGVEWVDRVTTGAKEKVIKTERKNTS